MHVTKVYSLKVHHTAVIQHVMVTHLLHMCTQTMLQDGFTSAFAMHTWSCILTLVGMCRRHADQQLGAQLHFTAAAYWQVEIMTTHIHGA